MPRAGAALRALGFVADVLRSAAFASLVASAVWLPLEASVRFVFLVLALLIARFVRAPRPFDAAFCAMLLLATWAGVAGWYRSIGWMDESRAPRDGRSRRGDVLPRARPPATVARAD